MHQLSASGVVGAATLQALASSENQMHPPPSGQIYHPGHGGEPGDGKNVNDDWEGEDELDEDEVEEEED